MERLEEILAGLGALIRERECELLERIELLEKKVNDLQEQLSAIMETGIPVQVPQISNDAEEEVSVAPAVGEDVPEIEIEFEFEGEETDENDWAEEYEEGDVVEDNTEDDIENDAKEVVGIEEEQGQQERLLVVDKVRPEWYDWEVDIPGAYIDDIWEGIGLNDRMLFLRELFGGNEEEFRDTVERLNGMEMLVQATEYIRERYPQWNEESDEVYRFYMTVRRRFNKQK